MCRNNALQRLVEQRLWKFPRAHTHTHTRQKDEQREIMYLQEAIFKILLFDFF